ncbi:MAG TPA: Fic family protein [Solirubrobacteraceae bacterium]|nr:Fic family protein [Solirubrobacteraceae bacterium]
MAEIIFKTPGCGPAELRVLELIDEARQQLRFRVAEPRRWSGSLRRMAFARAVQGSNSIEGYNASLDDVLAAVDDEPPLDADADTRLALAGYRDAMTYVLQIAQDPVPSTVDEGLLKALHFMMIKHDLKKNPGRWRPGAVFVRKEDSGEVVYEGPAHDRVPALIGATLEELERSEAPVLVRAAVAHLNLVMVHPFSDGNGRMARALQTLVLAREQIVAPVFSSIEEHLGRNTQAYYDVLVEVGQGSWNPTRSVGPWIEFCLTAHYRQAMTHLRRIEEAEGLWAAASSLAAAKGLPERAASALYDAAHGIRLRNAMYRKLVGETLSEEISDLTASRDLKAMVDADLLESVGQGRGRYYVPMAAVVQLRVKVRQRRPARIAADPFDLARDQLQARLPFHDS